MSDHPGALESHSGLRVEREHLDSFLVLDTGVVFLFDFGLPHAVEVATPISEFPMTRAELRGFIRADGPLGWMLGAR